LRQTPPPLVRSRLHATVAVLAAAALAFAPSALGKPRDLQDTIYEAKSRVMPALVHIQPVLEVYRSGEKGKMAVTGSGVIISEDGYVLTNNHVVQRAKQVTCTLADQQEVSRDVFTDLAVIRLNLDEVKGPIAFANLGRSADLEAGQMVMAMGSPLGLARSISLGVISTVDRYFPEARAIDGTLTGTFNTWIQTDAAINPGNSGGPLVNLQGEVIGINARAIPVFGENLGFAIPVDLAREVVEELLANGEVRRSWIGVSWQHLGAAPALAATPERKGALVASVVEGSPADEMGLAPGDVVLSVDAEPLTASHEEQLPHLRKWISDLPVGHSANVVYVRDGDEHHGTLVTRQLEDLETAEVEIREWGFTARTISEEMSRQLRLEDRNGALVTGVKPASFASEAGLRPGDIIQRMDDQEVPGLRVLEQRSQRLIEAERPQVLLEVSRGRTLNFILLEPSYGSRTTAEPQEEGDDR